MQARIYLMIRYVMLVTWECVFVFSLMHMTHLWQGLVVPPLLVALLFGSTDLARWAGDLLFGPQPSPSKALAWFVMMTLPLTLVVVGAGTLIPTSVLDLTNWYLIALPLAFLHCILTAFHLGPSFGDLIERYESARDEDYRREEIDLDDTAEPAPRNAQTGQADGPRDNHDNDQTTGVRW